MLRLDVIEMVCIEPARDAGDDRAEREGGDLEGPHVEAHEVGDALVVAHGGERDAEAGGEEQADDEEDRERKGRNGRQADIGRDRVAGRAAEHIEIEDGRLHDLAEREGRERQVDAARAQHRDRDDERDHAGHEPAEGNRERRGHAGIVAQVGGRIAADRREAGDAKVELARRHGQIGRIGEHDIDRKQHQDAFEVAAHARAPVVSTPPNSPVGRRMRIASSRP